MKHFAIAFSVLALSVMPSCAMTNNHLRPSSNMVTKTMNVGNFDGIEASRVKVVYTPGAAGPVSISAPDNIMPYVKVRVHDGDLECRIDRDIQIEMSSGPVVTVTVSAPAVDDFEASVSGIIQVDGNLNVHDFSAEANTAAQILVPSLTAADASFEASTAGVVTVNNAMVSDDVETEVSTGGVVTLNTLKAAKLEADITTGGVVNIQQGNINYGDLEATTGGVINAQCVTFGGGKASATTGGVINVSGNTLRRSASTGGSINN